MSDEGRYSRSARTDDRRIIVPLLVRYARWPGGDCALLSARIYGVPLWTVPVEDWLRIVRAGDE